MSVDAIPAGRRVLIDTNILIYAKQGMSAQCRHVRHCGEHCRALLTRFSSRKLPVDC